MPTGVRAEALFFWKTLSQNAFDQLGIQQDAAAGGRHNHSSRWSYFWSARAVTENRTASPTVLEALEKSDRFSPFSVNPENKMNPTW